MRFTVGRAESELADHVKAVLDPLFALYEFFELSDAVYTELVEDFKAGRIT